MIQSLTMQEVRVESLENLEALGGEVRLSANAGTLRIVFSKVVWDHLLANVPTLEEPAPDELAELGLLGEQLEEHAREHHFNSVLGGVQCGGSGLGYDPLLRPPGLFAMNARYHISPRGRPG